MSSSGGATAIGSSGEATATRQAGHSPDGERHHFRWAGRTFLRSIAAGFKRTIGRAQTWLEDTVGADADREQGLAKVHHGRAETRGR
jgi:hypothetical protein